MNGYSIFNHAQRGHVDTPEKRREPTQDHRENQTKPEAVPVQSKDHRGRSARGWAVEAGLGLGPRFKD